MDLVKREFPYLFKDTFSASKIPECLGGSFMPLNVVFCNGEYGFPFNEVSLGVIGYPDRVCGRKRECFTEMNVYFGLMYDLVFNEKFKSVAEMETKRTKMIENLGKFLTNEKHVECIGKLNLEGKDEKENTLQEVLAAHLFGPLLKNASVKVNGMRYKATENVKCKYCGAPVEKGDTSFGNSSVWHGHGDILLRHSVITVEVGEDEEEEESTRSYIDRFKDAYASEPVVKQAKLTADGDNGKVRQEMTVGNTVSEVKQSYMPKGPRKIAFKKESFKELNKTLAQVLAQTITNAFLQVKLHPHLQNHFIPSFLASNKYVTIHMYNPTEDILLTQSQAMPIMSEGKFKFETILSIWLALNMFEFSKAIQKLPHYDGLDEESKQRTSSFHQLIGEDRLRLYFEELIIPLTKVRSQNEEYDDESGIPRQYVIGLLKELESGLAAE